MLCHFKFNHCQLEAFVHHIEMSDTEPKRIDDNKTKKRASVVVTTECSDKSSTEDDMIKAPIKKHKENTSEVDNDFITLSGGSELMKANKNSISNSKANQNSLDVANSPNSFVLAVICNDVAWMSKMNKEKENTHTVLNFVPIKVLDQMGYHKAPYEKVDGANAKQLVYYDKKGKMLPGVVSASLANAVVVDGVKCIDWKTWNQHETSAQKNKWRGSPTDVVGCLKPGIPMTTYIFDEQKDTIMENSSTEEALKPFALAIIGVVVRSKEQCDKGYGISIKSIKVLADVSLSMYGMYNNSFFYNDKIGIGIQTNNLLTESGRSKVYETDLNFMMKLVKTQTNDQVSERPLVCVRLSDAISNIHSHKVHMQSNNKNLELEFFSEGSIYNNKRFRVVVPPSMFTMPETGLDWILYYYQWCLDSNMADIIFIHNEYQMNKMENGASFSSIDCCIVPNENSIFSMNNQSLKMNNDLVKSLANPDKQQFQQIDISNENKNNFSGFVIPTDQSGQRTFAVIIDKKVRTPKAIQSNKETTHTEIETQSSTKIDTHSSGVCRVYAGMPVSRKIWCAYLLEISDNKVLNMLPVGIRIDSSNQLSATDMKLPEFVDVYSNPNIFLD